MIDSLHCVRKIKLRKTERNYGLREKERTLQSSGGFTNIVLI